jgi:hypothetical protein
MRVMTEALWAIWTYAFSTPERATATFTGVLAISTILLWLSTRKLWKVTGIAAGHIPQVERAHVSGGAVRLTNDPHQFMVTINNYGKTPAFIGTIWAEIVPESTLPAVPVYEERQLGKFGGQVLPSGVMGCPAGIMRHWNGNAGQVIYGRIWYRDIFKQYHSGGFVLRIPDLVAVENRDAYWEDRPELDLGPAARPT